VIGPLVVWLLKKSDSAAVDAHGKESLNFQISMTICTLPAGLSLFVLIGFVLLPVALIVNLAIRCLTSPERSTLGL
jgi:uncharacterized Tic20 family protein